MNILIVDDEAMIREWMEFTLKNLPVELNLVDTATDGFDALEKISTTLYDLVFLDITMPRMDGIELIKHMNTLHKLPMIVILSSHDQFNYAREAFHYNASEYLLKSECTKEKLLELINQCNEKLMQDQLTFDLSYYRSALLTSVLTDTIFTAPLSISNLFTELISSSYCVIAYNRTEASVSKTIVLSEHRQKVFIGNSEQLSFFAYLIQPDLSISTLEKTLDLCTKNNDLQIGCSIPFSGVTHLKEAILYAYKAIQLLFYSEESFSVMNNTIRPENTMLEINQQCALILNNIKANDLDQARDNLSVLHHIITLNKPEDITTIKNINYTILSALLITLSKNTQQVMPNLDMLKQRMETSQKFSEIKAYTDEYFYFLDPLQSVTSAITSHYILESINYIHTKYASIESVSQIANRVHLNTDYFSRLFKKEVGIPASTYLMNYKLEIAAQLLSTTSMTVYEIALNVGYSNISYFSKIFKAKYTLQPSQYRKSVTT